MSFPSITMNQIIKILLPLLLGCLMTIANAAVKQEVALSKLKGQEWIQACQARGFDPSSLACGTCAILPKQHKADCQSCCQSYKDTTSLRKPYQSAIILVPTQGVESELEAFLREDWSGLAKSGRLQQLPLEDSQPQQQGFWFLRASPAELLFLDEPLPASSVGRRISETAVRRKASETISLYGWKREDIKDMIETLLVK
mmetsp:Transcript_26644/g.73513  ORF Transcript_26644/g.73513 Transcript_26644/m.73513 type:complete len:200 (-) Transcript_26644:257-856(-)